MHTVHRDSVLPGVDLTCIITDKFKTGCLSINLINGLKRDTASSSALLPRVLRRGSKELPDMEIIAAALDELYGTRIEPINRKKGELHCIGLHLDFPDDRFIQTSGSIFEKAVSYAGGILLSPIMESNLLRTDYTESERKNLIDDIRSVINDKRGYALDRLVEEMCSAEAYSIRRLGSEEEAAAITPETLTAHYRSIIESSKIEIYYCGATEPDLVKSALLSALADLPVGKGAKPPETEIVQYPPNDAPKRVSETLDVSQGKLVLGFRLGKAMAADPDYPAMMVFNSLYGSGVTSKLFVNVREKLALCYYASSMLDRHKGIMIVSSGVDFENFGVAENEILAQLGYVKKGDISELELNSAKKTVITSLKSSMDRPSGLLDLYFDGSVSATQYDPEVLCEMVEAVALENVVDVASEIELDTIYRLTGETTNN